MSYDAKTSSVFKDDSKKIGVLIPADDSSKKNDDDDIVEAKDEFTSKVKILWFPPANFDCVSIQAKLYHPSTGWIENRKEFRKIVCSNENERQSIDDDSRFVENDLNVDEIQLQSPTPDNDHCYKDGNCDEFSDQYFDTDYYEHDENEQKSVHVHSEL